MSDSWFKQWRKSLTATFLAYLAKGILRLTMATCRLQVEGLDHLNRAAQNGSCILILWHNRLAIMAEFLRKFAPQHIYAAFISNSNDGEVLAILAESYSFGRTIRVARQGRHLALRRMIQELQETRNVIIVTPDGPTGPLYRVKPGVGMASRETGAPVLALSWQASSFWELGTWDRLRIPKPFSTVKFSISSPVLLKAEDTDQVLQTSLDEIDRSLYG